MALEEIGARFRVTIFCVRKYPPTVDEIDQAILDALAVSKGLSTQEISIRIKRSPRATRTRLLNMIERGQVREVGTSPQDPKRRYFLATKG